jgi:ATP-dependent helicase/nuclease subunit A
VANESQLQGATPDPTPRAASILISDRHPPPPLPEVDATIFAFRRNVVVAASAGTGKTHRLTALYLLLTLGLTSMGEADDRSAAPVITPERIIATTFSRAAALEISLRIEHALASYAAWDGVSSLPFSPIVRAREAILGLRLSLGEVKKRAGDALARWSSAKIDTLHGVARRIVQRHALAIGLPPGARVLDEEEAQALGDLAVDEALGAALTEGGERAETARWLIISAGGVGGARRQVRRLLDRLDEEGLTPRELAIADHEGEARALSLRLLRIAKEAASLGSPVFREPAAALAAALEPALTVRAVRQVDEAAAPAVLLPDAAIPSLFALLTQRMPARTRRLPADDALDEFIGALQGKSKLDRAHGLAALLRHAPELGARERRFVDLIEDARARLDAAKRRACGLGFGDLLRIARDTLRDRPEIARATRETAAVLLVDEFQDTSRVQRDLVYLLREREDAAEARPRGCAPLPPGLTGHGLFLVGDRKQSIYGFRGADVAVFSRVCVELAGKAAAEALAMPDEDFPHEPTADFVALRESRRSGARILSFVNAFAARDFAEGRAPSAAPREFEISYGPAEHLVPAEPPLASEGGEVVFIDDDGATPEDADPIVRESAGAAREAHIAAAYVADLMAAPPTAAGSPATPVRYRDIAILARRRSSIPLIELALGRLSIPYVVAGRALYDAPEVRDVAALLRLLLDPRDRLALATVLRGPVVALSETSLARLSVPGRGLSVPLLGPWSSQRARADGDEPPQEGDDAFEAIGPSEIDPQERARLDAFRARFVDLRRAALRLTPGEAIRAAITAVDLDRILAALPRAEARIGNIDRLVNIARRRGGTLASFVRWLDRRMRDEADEAEAAVFSAEDDAVRLTTIHASKGLDFPVVILLDMNAEPRADHGGIGFIAESARSAPTLVVRHYAPRPPPGRPLVPSKLSALPDLGVTLLPIVTGALRAAQAEARAREQAERRRLTYVAVTRPRSTLVLVGSAAAPRTGSAFQSLTAGVLSLELADQITTPERAAELLARARPSPLRPTSVPLQDLRPPARPPRSPSRLLSIGTTALALFHDCPRRFRMRHLLGIEEPAWGGQLDLFAAAEAPEPTDDLPLPIDADEGAEPRARGRAAHRVIQRWPLPCWGAPTDAREVMAKLVAEGLAPEDSETAQIAEAVARFLAGLFARKVREESARAEREHAFVLSVEMTARGVRRLALRGAIDLLVEHPDGRLDVIDYKLSRARGDLSPHAPHEFQLRAYALAVQRRATSAPVRAGVIFLGGAPDPIWLPGAGAEGTLTDADHERFEAELISLSQRFVDARYQDRFEGVAASTCRRLRCGFLEACHGNHGSHSSHGKTSGGEPK